ncbi:hypothetical protein [Trujillonella endophytica]|uniref:hypothetical protein n=1 Tax=Trujillonella endophytica TaxID=673521 RepID=UPI000B83E42F|nr:hypothetical protein [Trujillella endophytica]
MDDAGRAGSGPGGLDGLLGTGPAFPGALRGYDRLQVDNYVAWAESEIALARREVDHLLSRYAGCSADLQSARLRLAQFARDRETAQGRGEAEEVLARARAEAEALTAAAVAQALEEAERIGAEARTEAQARLEKVENIRAAAVAERDTARIEARGLRSEAEAVLAAARADAAALLAAARERRSDEDARAHRDRESAEAAAASRLAGVQVEVDDLRRQRDEARQSLRRLTGQLEEALSSVAASLPPELLVLSDDRRPVAS